MTRCASCSRIVRYLIGFHDGLDFLFTRCAHTIPRCQTHVCSQVYTRTVLVHRLTRQRSFAGFTIADGFEHTRFTSGRRRELCCKWARLNLAHCATARSFGRMDVPAYIFHAIDGFWHCSVLTASAQCTLSVCLCMCADHRVGNVGQGRYNMVLMRLVRWTRCTWSCALPNHVLASTCFHV